MQTASPRRKPGVRRFFPRRKVCQFCVDKVTIDYKDVQRIRRFVSEWGKIESRRKTGTCSPHQRQLSTAIKRARYLAWLPYTGSHSQIELGRPDRGGPRRPPFRDGPPAGRDFAPPPAAAPVEAPSEEGAAVETAEAPAAEAPVTEAAVAKALESNADETPAEESTPAEPPEQTAADETSPAEPESVRESEDDIGESDK